MMHTPVADVAIDQDLVRALLAAQHPDLAQLPLNERQDGWDNAIFRLGDDLAVRLPRREVGALLGPTEWHWLPRISRNWRFPVPTPVRLGEPGEGYPWRWSVVPWLAGERAFDAPLTELGARDLGAAIAQIQLASVADAPVNPYRGGTLGDVAELFDARVRGVEATQDLTTEQGARLRAIFAAGAATAEPDPTWGHLDLHGGNVLTRGGRLAGVIDWGDAAGADPATDLGQACVLVGAVHADALLGAYGTADGPMRVGAGTNERRRVAARAVAFAVTLAAMDERPFAAAGLKAAIELVDAGLGG